MADIVVDTSDGFVDFRIPVLQSRILEAGEAILIVGGLLLDRLIEIEFHLEPGMLPNDLGAENVVINARSDGIQMSLAGTTGRDFVLALCELYGTPRSSVLVPLKLSFTAIALAGDPANIATEVVKFKLFHETGSTDEDEGPEYFEMFLNLDLPSGLVELNEKDTDFRSGVLNAFPTDAN